MKPLIIFCFFQLIGLFAYGQEYYIDGEIISKRTARKHIKKDKFYYLTYGEFESIPQRRCEAEVWAKYGCTINHISNYGVPEADEYNEVLFNYLKKEYGSKWKMEKDSLLHNCLTNNICGININKWNFTSYDFPDIVFEQNKYDLTELSRCMLIDFFRPLFFKIQDNQGLYIKIFATEEKEETIENLTDKRCNSIASFLIEQGIKEEKLIIGGKRDGIYSDYNLNDYENIKKWNRVAFFQIIEK